MEHNNSTKQQLFLDEHYRQKRKINFFIVFDFIVLYYQLPIFLEIDSNEPLPLRPAAGADAHKIIVSTRIRVVLGEQYTIFLLIVFITLIIKNVYNRIFFKIGYKNKSVKLAFCQFHELRLSHCLVH